MFIFAICFFQLSLATWQILPSAPPGRRDCNAWCKDSDTVYLFGGKTSIGRTNDMWKYEIAHGWSQLSLSTQPSSRSGACSWTVGSTLYLFGGRDDAGNAYNDFWKFENSQWTQQSTPSTVPGLYGSSCWVYQDKLYMYGGTIANKTNTVSLFVFSDNAWAPQSYTGTGPGAIDDAMTVQSGAKTYLFTDNLYVFDGDSNSFAIIGSQTTHKSRQDTVI